MGDDQMNRDDRAAMTDHVVSPTTDPRDVVVTEHAGDAHPLDRGDTAVGESAVDGDLVDPDVVDQRAGDPAIASAVERLGGLTSLPPSEHVEVYEDVHAVLQEALAAAARPAPGSGRP